MLFTEINAETMSKLHLSNEYQFKWATVVVVRFIKLTLDEVTTKMIDESILNKICTI